MTCSLVSMPDNALIVNSDAEYIRTSYFDQEVSHSLVSVANSVCDCLITLPGRCTRCGKASSATQPRTGCGRVL